MTKNKRRKYTPAQNIALLSQVEGVCKLCLEPLIYQKKGKSYKSYENAHIYPLNPTDKEEKLLAKEKKLSEDPNDDNNIIPLCKTCHGKFDKPRTVEEYRTLFEIKEKLIKEYEHKNTLKSYQIIEDINNIIDSIYNELEFDAVQEINYQTKEVDKKLDQTITVPTKIKIKNYVNKYYPLIKERLKNLDKSKTGVSNLLISQIKSYYLLQKLKKHDQQIIFQNIVDWINKKSSSKTIEPAEIITSFFIQNCEVFE